MEILRIGEILKNRKLSIKDFASLTGLSYTYTSEIVRNVKFPRKETLLMISKVLDVDIRDLLISTKNMDKTNNEIVEEIQVHLEELKKRLANDDPQ